MLLHSMFALLTSPAEHSPAARSNRRAPPKRQPVRLCLEALEDRTLPATSAIFGGLPYTVGPTITPTTTAPEFEESIAVSPSDPKTLVAAIIDGSLQRPGLHATYKYAFSFDNGKTWTEKFIPNVNLSTGNGFPVTGDGQVWTNTFDGDVAIDRSGNAYLASSYSRATVDDANGIYVCVASLGRGDLNFTAAHTTQS